MSRTRRRLSRLPSRIIRLALGAWVMVVIALTMLKAYYQIGYLWKPEAHHHRGIDLLPFSQVFRAKTWFGPLFDAFGNIALFIPIGLLLAMLWQGTPKLVKKIALVGFGLSLAIEVSQYIFALGYTDIDDLILNTAGAAAGGGVARRLTAWVKRLLVWAILAACAVFAVLVMLGPRLGDPAKVVG